MRSVSSVMLLASSLEANSKQREAVVADPDFEQLQNLVLEYDSKFPEHPNPWLWIFLRNTKSHRVPDLARRILSDEIGYTRRAIALRLKPLGASNALLWHWQYQVPGKEAEARPLLQNYASRV